MRLLNANELVGVVFSRLAPLVVEEVADEGEVIRVRARTPGGPADCPDCGGRTGRVHAVHERTVTDAPVDAGRVVIGGPLLGVAGTAAIVAGARAVRYGAVFAWAVGLVVMTVCVGEIVDSYHPR
ncbi:hypothetical protein [Embleya sp. NPDC005575]|uniref:hypothetical protein n=1 Tax=Embleya sp. NPDC005575 TaxID=3156892 RepID=UPI0033B0BA2B